MTTVAPGSESSVQFAAPRRHVGLFVLAFIGGLVGAISLASIGLAAWDSGYQARVLPGVHVGDVDLSGLDRTAAAQALGAAYDLGQGRIVLRTPAGDLWVPYSTFGRRPDVEAMVDEALGAGRAGNPAERALEEARQAFQGTTLEPLVALDDAALTARIGAALATVDRAPVDATIFLGPDGPATTPSSDGRVIDPAPVVATALASIRRGNAPSETIIYVQTTEVAPPRGNLAVAIARLGALRMIQDVVVTDGASSWTIPATTVEQALTFQTPADGSVRPVVDSGRIAATLGGVAKAILRKPVSASFLASSTGKVVGVTAGSNGRQLDVDATTTKIVAELTSRSDGNRPRPVEAVTEMLAPALTTEEATRTAPLMKKLGTWTTWFPISDRNYYGANIWLPALIINGTVLAPGQTFDWWRAIGPVTTARGFGPGGVIKVDHTDPTGALGGGMCSSSTTLFNAALRAGLKIDARSNHRYYISRYPLGLDATVSKSGGSEQTMSFTNDTGHAILIRGIRLRGSGGRGYVRYEIWGIPDGRQVTIGRAVVTNLRQATTNTVYVSTLPHGARLQTEYPANGMDVSVTRTVRNAAGQVIHQETYRSPYALWNGRIEVGI